VRTSIIIIGPALEPCDERLQIELRERDRLAGTGFYQDLDMIADPDDPRDLFGMLQRAKG